MGLGRRSFLGTLGAGAALAPAFSTAESGSLDGTDSDARGQLPRTLAEVRDAFAFSESTIPMNAANLCPSPRIVASSVSTYTQDIDQDCSFQNRDKFQQTLETTRRSVAALLGVSDDTVALVRNTSEANNVINNGIDLAAGDEVVLWAENHPTNYVAWQVRAARFDFSVKVVQLPAAPSDIQQLLDPFINAFTARTRVLAVSQVSNISGLALPLAELVTIAHARGIHVHVDGAQTWGIIAQDLNELGVDSYTASAHKWYMGPKEVGLLYVHPSAIPRIWPGVVASGWGTSIKGDSVGARRFESLGQRDDAALAALGVAAQMHAQLGAPAVQARARQLASRLKEGLLEAGAQLVTPLAAQFSAGVCVTRVEPANRGELFDRLYREHGIAGAPTGGLRLCPHIYNTDEHIDRAIAGVAALKHLLA